MSLSYLEIQVRDRALAGLSPLIFEKNQIKSNKVL